MKKILAFVLAMVMVFALGVSALADEPIVIAPAPAGDVTVYYTNDVHTYIDKDNNYAKLATLYKGTQNALLVDAGDHVQGTAYGGMDKGASIVKLMEAVGYDVATLGNHEFDYGMTRALEIATKGTVPYVSCNFYNEKNGVVGDLVLDAYKVFEVAGKKIAFVGVTTPESFTKSTPKYFQDDNGNYIYGIAGGTDGAALYAAVQKAIDAAAAEADVVIGLGHLGDDPASDPWNSEDVIANTTGFDAFIDGHSHSTVDCKEVADKAGNVVILSQTGNYFSKVGKMTIAADGTIAAELISLEGVEADAEVAAINDGWMSAVDTELNQKIASSAINFTTKYENGNRAVRSTETNMGDLNADAYYWMGLNAGLEPDMAIMNGGGIRADIAAGDWTYKSCKTVNTFGNVLCVVEITGQQILDALEFGARFTTGDPDNLYENGGFLQVAGCTYTVDTTIANGVTVDDKNVWTAGPETYRVSDVKIFDRTTGTYEALDLEKTYRVCGTNYTLYDCGDGFNMFKGGTHVLDGISEDYMAMASYLQAFKGGVISSATSPLAAYKGYKLNYENAFGAGRIALTVGAFTDVAPNAYYKDAVLWAAENGITTGATETTFDPDGNVTREQAMTFLYRYAEKLDLGFKGSWMFLLDFTDTAAIDDWAYAPVAWGKMKGIVNGYEDGSFKPAANIIRQDVAVMFNRFVEAIGGDTEVDPETNYLSFGGLEEVGEYALHAIVWAQDKDIMNGDAAGNMLPLNNCTRAQFVTMLYRLANLAK